MSAVRERAQPVPLIQRRRDRLVNWAVRVARFEEALAAAPGSRFTARYEARVSERGRSWRPSRVILAVALFTIGMLNIFIPGPGGSVFIMSSALVLSAESRVFARFLDRSELRFLPQVRWMLAHPLIVSSIITCGVLLLILLPILIR